MEVCSIFFTGILTCVFVSSAMDYKNFSSSIFNITNATEMPFTVPVLQTPYVTKDNGLHERNISDKKCKEDYSVTCLKFDLIKFMDGLTSKNSFQIIPGLSIIKKPDKLLKNSPIRISTNNMYNKIRSLKELDTILFAKVEEVIHSFSFQLQPRDPFILKNIKNTGREIIDTLSTETVGRSGITRRRRRTNTLLWTAAVMAALGFAAMSAVAGKALMASMMALMVSALAAFRGGGPGLSGYKTAHYEIITKPVHHYTAPAITAPAHFYDHDHIHTSYTPAYDYARTLAEVNKALAAEVAVNDNKEPEMFKPRLQL